MVLYRPREEQRYYYGADQTEVYWVHFTGSNVKNILKRYGFPDNQRVFHVGTSLEDMGLPTIPALFIPVSPLSTKIYLCL